eukprot:9185_1
MESYTWKVTDKTLIRQIKSTKQGECFSSQPFRLFNLSFQLEVYPNGVTTGGEHAGNVKLFLHIRGLSPNVHSINLNRRCKFVEAATVVDSDCNITQEHMYCTSWRLGSVKTADIQKLNQMTFKVDVMLFTVFDKDGEDITNKYLKNVEHKTDAVSTEDQQ